MQTSSLPRHGLLRSNIRRFWPLWAVYLLACLFFFVAPLYAADVWDSVYAGVADQIGYWSTLSATVLPLTFCGSLAAALNLNERLFKASSATFYGALPMRRRDVFLASYGAGLLPLLAVEVVVALAIMPLALRVPGVGAAGALQWFVLAAGCTFLFFSMAELVCELTGSAAVAGFLFLLLNVLTVCVEVAVKLIFGSMLRGVEMTMSRLTWASPVIGVARYVLIATGHSPVSWAALAAYCAAGLVFLLFALWLDGRRDLERAGDVMAYDVLEPVLVVLASLCGGLLLGAFFLLLLDGGAYFGNTSAAAKSGILLLPTLAGAFLGALFSQMVISRSTRVLKKCLAPFAVVAAVLLVMFACFRLDVLGVERYVPDAGEVRQVSISMDGNDNIKLTSDEAIQEVCSLHSDLLDYEQSDDSDVDHTYATIAIAYTLADGSIVSRSYDVSCAWDENGDLDASDDGYDLMMRASALTNSEEAKRSLLADVIDGSESCSIEIDYSSSADGDYEVITITGKQATDFAQNVLEPDLILNEQLHLSYSWFVNEENENLIDATIWVYDANGEPLAVYAPDPELTPQTFAWLAEHYPGVQFMEVGEDGNLQPVDYVD